MDIREREAIREVIGEKKVVLVMGNEGKGVSGGVGRECEGGVKIDQKNGEYPYSLVDSLNVSASCAVLVHCLMGYV